jgi:hypothetical protein
VSIKCIKLLSFRIDGKYELFAGLLRVLFLLDRLAGDTDIVVMLECQLDGFLQRHMARRWRVTVGHGNRGAEALLTSIVPLCVGNDLFSQLWPDRDPQFADPISQGGPFHPQFDRRAFGSPSYPVRVLQGAQHVLPFDLFKCRQVGL